MVLKVKFFQGSEMQFSDRTLAYYMPLLNPQRCTQKTSSKNTFSSENRAWGKTTISKFTNSLNFFSHKNLPTLIEKRVQGLKRQPGGQEHTLYKHKDLVQIPATMQKAGHRCTCLYVSTAEDKDGCASVRPISKGNEERMIQPASDILSRTYAGVQTHLCTHALGYSLSLTCR